MAELLIWPSIILGLASMATAVKMGVDGKGKLITRPMRHWAFRRAETYLRKGDIGKWAFWIVTSEQMRGFQIMFLMPALLAYFALVFTDLESVAYWIILFGYWWPYTTLFLDDIITGKDRNWKKKWDAVKNKIRWKWLPTPRPVLVPTR